MRRVISRLAGAAAYLAVICLGLSYAAPALATGTIYTVAQSGNIYRLDPDTGGVLNSFASTGGSEWRGLAYGDGRLFFGQGTTINELNPDTGSVLHSIPSPIPVDGLGFSGTELFVTSNGSTSISVLDPDTGAVIRSFTTTVALNGGLTFAGDRNVLYGSNATTIYMLDPSDGAVLLSHGVTYPVEGLGYSVSRGTLFYGTMINNIITELDPETFSTVGGFNAPVVCVGLAADEVQKNTPPVLDTNAGVALYEGATTAIPNTVLATSDAEQTASEITYTVTSAPAHGTLYLDGTPLTGSPFTQQDIDNYLLSYTHDGSQTTSDSFSFQLTDGYDIVGPYTFNITVVPLDHIAPTSAITDPLDGAILYGNSYTIMVTANDSGGSGVVSVEVSTDGGATWHEAAGYGTWTYDWSITADGNYTILSRATDSMDNVETPGPGVSLTVNNSQLVSLVKTWGYNANGQLGDWTTTNSNTPVKTRGIGRIDSVSAGATHTVAISPDGTVWAWGDNTYGQLGDGTNTSSGIPVRVSGLADVDMVAGGGGHTVALMTDGTVWAWGDNTYGQLGDGTNTSSNTPVQVVMSDGVTPLSGVAAVSAGTYHTVALMEEGTVMAWGDNTYGELGDGTFIPKYTPVTVLLSDGITPLSGVDAVSVGDSHTVVLMSSGTVMAWGHNTDGQLGDGTNTNSAAPVQVSSLSGAVAVSAGSYHTVALMSGGTVRSWGDNSWGQLGDGTNTDSNVPVTVSGLSGVSAVAGGWTHTVVLKNDGTVVAWGYNGMGSLGDGTNTDSKVPVQVTNLTDVTSISAGLAHTAALTIQDTIAPSSAVTNPSDGATLDGLSYTITGTADDGSGSGVAAVEVSTDGGTTWRLASDTSVTGDFGTWRYNWNIMADGGYTIVSRARDASDNTEIPGPGISVTVDNSERVMPIKTWGANTYGQLGDGTTTDSSTPVQVSGLAGAVAVAAGTYHTVALMPDGTVRAWGANTYGQLGDGTNNSSLTPVEVLGPTGVVAVEVGAYHTVALGPDGMVFTWGLNDAGQLGDGTLTNREVAYMVPDLYGVAAISAGDHHTIALKSDGTVMAWGDNNHGQLGDGTTLRRTTPVQVSGLTDVVAVSAGGEHSVAVKSDGTVWTWGNNDHGQLGNTSVTQSDTPVQVMLIDGVTPLSGAFAVSAGYQHTVALMSNGEVMTWGRGDYGQLGSGDFIGSPTPVPVFSTVLHLSGVVAVSAGSHHTVALKSDGTVVAWGYNQKGQIGDGTNDNTCIALPVAGLSGAAAVAAGGVHSVALQCMPDTAPPVSTITAPFDATAMPSGIYFYPVTGTVSDYWPGTGATRVEVSADGGATWEDAEATDVNPDGSWNEWEYTWIVAGDGAFTIMSRATDMVGNVETPGPGVTVFVDNTAPTSSITSPIGGASLTGSVCIITGTADDGTGAGVLGVEVSTDGGATWNLAKGKSLWSYTWTLPANGDCNIRTRATDYSGNRETPGPGISVSVANTLGAVSLDAPSYFGPMATVTVTVEDADADATAGPGNDTVVVTATSLTDPVGETLTLAENPSVAGEFTGTFGFEPIRIFTDNGAVGISKGESVTVSFLDNLTPSGSPQTATGSVAWDCGRAVWVLYPDNLINDAGTARADLYAFCAAPHGNPAARVDTIYIAAYNFVTSGPDLLRGFIAGAHANGLRVECMGGVPDWATPAGAANAEAMVTGITSFNDSSLVDQRFDGVHFHVQPELLPTWSTDMGAVWATYTAMLGSCQTIINGYNTATGNSLSLGVDMPDWYDTVNPGVVDSSDVQDIADYTVVQTLSDSSAVIIPATRTEVDYAATIVKKAYVGFETACNIYTDPETFCEEGPAALDAEVALVEADNSAAGSYLGAAVNYYSSYCTLVRTELTLDSLTPSILNPATIGDTVDWTAAGSGGSGYYEYDFWIKEPSGLWINVQPWSTLETWSWSPIDGDEGVYKVFCAVRDANDHSQMDIIITGYNVALPPATAETLTPSAPGPVTADNGVTWTATASGGTGSYEYQFWLRYPDGTWVIEQDYSSADTWNWTPSVAGSYQVLSCVRSAGSPVQYDDLINYGWYDVVYSPAAAVSLTPSVPVQVTAGNPVTWTATASGGTGSYEYRFWLRYPDGSWAIVQDYSSADTWNWTPSVAGSYQVLSCVRSAGSPVQYDDLINYGWYNVVYPPAAAVSLTPDVPSPAAAGNPVTWTATASGGTGSYEYRFWLRYPDGTWVMEQDYSAVNTWNWTPTATGSYQVVFCVRSTGSPVQYDNLINYGWYDVQ